MTEEQRIHTILSVLKLPVGQYVLAGSGSMILHGIKRERPMGDLDLLVSTNVWFHLYENSRRKLPKWELFIPDAEHYLTRCDPPYLHATFLDLPVHIFFSWRQRDDGIGNINTATWIMMAEMIDGIPCVPLRRIFDWKREVGREKDIEDIRLMASILEEA